MEMETAGDSSQLRVDADFRFRRLQWDGDNCGGVGVDAHHLEYQYKPRCQSPLLTASKL